MDQQGRHSQKHTKSELMEWEVCEDESDWISLGDTQVETTVTAPRSSWWNRHKLSRSTFVAALLLLVVGLAAGWWLWHQAQLGEAQTEDELHSAVEADLWRSVHLPATQTNVREAIYLKEMLSQSQSDEQEQVSSVEIRNQGDDWAVIRVLLHLHSDGPVYRQMRVYRNGARGWQRAAVTTAVWGQARHYESEHFAFDYRSLDDDAVVEAAPLIENSYRSLYHTLFGSEPEMEKVVIVIDPERRIQVRDSELQPADAITVGSPAALLAPSKLSEGEVLAQAVVLELAFRLTQRVNDQYEIPSQWRQVSNGLRLWLLWNQELPLAAWKRPVVRWVFGQTPNEALPGDTASANFAADLCANHSLWMATPLEIGIWVVCFPHDGSITPADRMALVTKRLASPFNVQIPAPPATAISRFDRITARTNSSTDSVVLATVVDYVVAQYGIDRVPALIKALPQYRDWKNLTPALLGVSQEEFTRGWHEFLHKQYGIPQ